MQISTQDANFNNNNNNNNNNNAVVVVVVKGGGRALSNSSAQYNRIDMGEKKKYIETLNISVFVTNSKVHRRLYIHRWNTTKHTHQKRL